MNREDFESLVKSVTEGVEIVRGETHPSREFKVKIEDLSAQKDRGFALCVKSDEPDLLIPSKVYQARYSSSDLVGIVDEAGESAIYPADHFIKLNFPSEVQSVLGHLQKAA